MFGAIIKLCNNAIDLDFNEVMTETYNEYKQDFSDLVVTLNTEEQLFEGINSLSIPLSEIGGNYSPVTVSIKRSNSQPTNRVTLKDTGDFYNSFNVIIESDGFVIDSDSIKDGIDLTERWGKDIVGLTDLSKEALIFFLRPLLVEVLHYKLMDGVF